MLPYITVFLLMLIIEGMLNNLSLYGYFFPGNFSYIGFGNSIKQLFLYGNCYAWWMGGAWFVVELFAIEILHSVLVSLSNKSTFIYLALVGIVYYTGYYFIHRAAYIRIGPIYNDLAFIGLAFYSMGFLARQTRLLDRLTDTFTKKCFMCSLSISILYIFANVIPTTVDYPSRSFNDPVIDLLIGLNGCFFIFFVAKAVEKVRYLENIFACLGKNTLGVVFFHFQFFKLGGFLLYFLNIIPFSDISNLLPAYEAGTKWWWLFAVISLAASVAEWKMLTAIKGIRFFFGAERKFWGDIYMKISERNIKIYENK